MTETPGSDKDGIEKRVLGHLGFKVIGDEQESVSNKLQVDKELDPNQLDTLLMDWQRTSPVLVFCHK